MMDEVQNNSSALHYTIFKSIQIQPLVLLFTSIPYGQPRTTTSI